MTRRRVGQADTGRKGRAWLQVMTCGAVGLAACGSAKAADLTLRLPDTSIETRTEQADLSSYSLPTGAWRDGILPVDRREGQVLRRAYRIEDSPEDTLALISPLRDQLRAAGYEIAFECATGECGGFDFRFATEVLPEPDMHVDLGDYRFLTATQGADRAVTVLVSRSLRMGHVQIVEVSPPAEQDEGIAAAADDSGLAVAGNGDGTGLATTFSTANRSSAANAPQGSAQDMLGESGRMILEGLEFATGEARLEAGEAPALTRLAEWLNADAGRRVTLVGHTDASGSLEANVTLSRRRAEAVRDRLMRDHGIGADRIAAEGVGYLSPRDSNLTEEGRTRNRRVEAIVTSTR